MDLGVWMSREVLEHKRQVEGKRMQTWNVGYLADECSRRGGPHRLFVAVEGYWRGYFELLPYVNFCAADKRCPWTLIFDPRSWTAIDPVPAPRRGARPGYTVEVPSISAAIPNERSERDRCDLEIAPGKRDRAERDKR